MLEAKGHTISLSVEFQHLHVNLISNGNDFTGMLDTLPSHVRYVQETVDTTQVDKGAVVRQVLHDTLQLVPFLEALQQLFALFAVL